jgi:hypothetical protein
MKLLNIISGLIKDGNTNIINKKRVGQIVLAIFNYPFLFISLRWREDQQYIENLIVE